MAYVKSLTTALSVLFIAGCSPTPKPLPARPPPPAKTESNPLSRQLDRARDAQTIVDEHAAKTRDAIDDQERGDSHP
jgi:uncharacterized lipoprotein YajG